MKCTHSWRFRVTRDICRGGWLVLHQVQHIEHMRYLGLQATRCASLQALRDRALSLATSRGHAGAAVDDGKVVRVSEEGPREQFVLGNVQGSVVSADERHIAAVQVPSGGVGGRADVGVFTLQKGARVHECNNWKAMRSCVRDVHSLPSGILCLTQVLSGRGSLWTTRQPGTSNWCAVQ